MAVESRHMNFFQTVVETTTANMNPYYVLPPLSGTITESFVPMYNNGVMDSFSAKGAVKADSGLTYAHQFPVSRKRSRDSVIPMMNYTNGQIGNGNQCGSFTFLGEDVSLQIQQQQWEMDSLIAQHNEKVRMEMEERRNRYSRRIIAAVEESITLKAKDDEIEKMLKLNWALEEKVKSLSMEGQIWRDLAHTNEAAAHALRANLEQVLANNESTDVATRVDDAESCCASKDVPEEGEECSTRIGERMCKHCGKGVSSVLLFPCRHLCLCTVCRSSVLICPLCSTPKNASVQVIMSS